MFKGIGVAVSEVNRGGGGIILSIMDVGILEAVNLLCIRQRQLGKK
jgi:hypothetical protein